MNVGVRKILLQALVGTVIGLLIAYNFRIYLTLYIAVFSLLMLAIVDVAFSKKLEHHKRLGGAIWVMTMASGSCGAALCLYVMY